MWVGEPGIGNGYLKEESDVGTGPEGRDGGDGYPFLPTPPMGVEALKNMRTACRFSTWD